MKYNNRKYEYNWIRAYCERVGGYDMKNEYKVKEVFDDKATTIEEKLKEVFFSFLIEQINK